MEKIFEWLLPIKKDDGMVLRGIRVGETAPIVRMHLIDDSGKGADITGVDAVSVAVERSDGMKVALTLSVQAVLCFCPAVVELSFADERLSAVAGLCVGIIDFYSGDARMTSARFRYNVEPGIVVSDNEVAGDPEYSMFVGAMTDLAKLNEDVSKAENARNVFEVFDPYKEYVRGNKVAFGGASYVLVAERSKGENPMVYTDKWLCIAEKGDRGEKGEKGEKGGSGIHVRALGLPFDCEVGRRYNAPKAVDTSEMSTGDFVFDSDGGCLFTVDLYLADGNGEATLFPEPDYRCVANVRGYSKDKYGNVTYGDNHVGCKAYYIKSIDLTNKKIYLSETKVVPVISTADNTDTSFATPAYDVGDGFSIVNKNHYNNCGTIASVVNNVVTYSEDSLGFTAINEDTDGGIADYTFHVYNKPDVGVVLITKNAFAVGVINMALGAYSSAEGGGNVADGFYSHVEGVNNYAAYGAHAEGGGNMAIGNESHAEGHKTKATVGNAHSEGQNTTASGGGAHAEGMGSTASGSQSHAEGLNTTAKGAHSHAEGVSTQANYFASHAEGNGTIASAAQAHAEGYRTIASGQSSHVEGQDSEASGTFSHAQGIRSYAKGYAAFTSGADVEASGDISIAMGKNAKATARASLAVGENVTASGSQSAAIGQGTNAKQQGQVVVGRYNADDSDAIFIVGNGTASARKNVFTVKKDGTVLVNGAKHGILNLVMNSGSWAEDGNGGYVYDDYEGGFDVPLGSVAVFEPSNECAAARGCAFIWLADNGGTGKANACYITVYCDRTVDYVGNVKIIY